MKIGKEREVFSLSASEVAKLIAGEPSGSEEARVFGEIFHETFCYHSYIQDKYGPLRHGFKAFSKRLAYECRNAGLGKEWITYGIRLAAALIANGARGRVPPTACVEIADGIILYAKPDLETLDGRYIELKTQPATGYEKIQCMIFGLALDSEITLMYPKEAKMDRPVEVIVERIKPYLNREEVIELIKKYGRREVIYEEEDEEWIDKRIQLKKSHKKGERRIKSRKRPLMETSVGNTIRRTLTKLSKSRDKEIRTKAIELLRKMFGD